jgi:hypothetical protein
MGHGNLGSQTRYTGRTARALSPVRNELHNKKETKPCNFEPKKRETKV